MGQDIGVTDPATVSKLAHDICLRQLAAAPKTRAQLMAVLARKGVPEDVAAEVLDRMEGVGLVNDMSYANDWVRSRHQGRGLSRGALRQELRARGIADEIATEALATIDNHAETEAARLLVAAKLRATAGLPVETRVRRLVGMLGRKGYGQGLSVRVVREALALEPDVDAADRRMLDSLDGPLSDAARVGD